MLNANLCLQQEHTKYEKAQKRRAAKTAPPKRNQSKKAAQAEDGYHYIAYVPIHGSVWRFDGLLQQPTNIGTYATLLPQTYTDRYPGSYTDDWLSIAQDNISSRISFGDQTHFNLMVVRDDLLNRCASKIASVLKSITAIERRLGELNRDWQAFIEPSMRTAKEVISSCDLQPADLGKADILESSKQALARSTPEELLAVWKELLKARDQLENDYMEEVSNSAENKDIVDRRLHDLTPDIYHSIQTLSHTGKLKGIAMELAAMEEAASSCKQGKEDGEYEVLP
jgi:ubiquitin carboxyl-terminal hydrolase L5